MQLNLSALQNVEVDVESLADVAVSAIPGLPGIFTPIAQKLLNVGLGFAFDWLNTHFGATATATTNISASAITHPPSAAATAAVATSAATPA